VLPCNVKTKKQLYEREGGGCPKEREKGAAGVGIESLAPILVRFAFVPFSRGGEKTWNERRDAQDA